jgi:Cu+-exporting ATPase
MQELQAQCASPAEFEAQAKAFENEGASVSALAQQVSGEWQLLGLMAFADEPKPGAKEAIAELRAQGIRTVMISGDNWGAARAMASRLSLNTAPDSDEVIAEVLPADKAARVLALKSGSNGQRLTVAMVGDGVNDAPALAAADVGMAMANGGGASADVVMQAAGITLMRGDPRLVSAALDISSRTVAKIRQNLFWAFFYNAAGIPLAALGYLNPVLAGSAMALSSVSVMANALLLKRWKRSRTV